MFVGVVKSDWAFSEPPHIWLFSDHQLKLRMKIVSELLIAKIVNVTSNRINVWEFDTPWGWDVISFKLKTADKEYVVKRAPKPFQENP